MFGSIFKIILLLLLPTSLFATTAVTGKMQTLGTGNISSGAFMRFWLRGCAGNQPRVAGTGLIGPSQGGVFYFDIAADSSGNISGTLYSTRDAAGTGNGQIECGGSLTAVWYGMQAFVAGKGGPEVPVHAKNTATLDITQVTPITTNPVVTSPTGDSTYARVDAGNLPFTGNVDFSAAMRANNGGVLSGTFTGNHTETGNVTETAGQNSYSAFNIDNILFVDGIKYTTFASAFADCPAVGCTIDMRGNSSGTALALGAVDPSTKYVNLLLGPYTYTTSGISLRPGLRITGTGSGSSASAAGGTIVKQSGTTNPVFTLGGTTAVFGVTISHLRVYCAAGNTTQIGFNIVAQTNGGGLWYSQFEDMHVGGTGTNECGGGAFVFDGNSGGANPALNQFLSFTDVQAYRQTNGSPALTITGLNGQMEFRHCEFDGPNPRDNNKVNVLINDGTQAFRPPYTFLFSDSTFQQAWGATGVAIQLGGVTGFTCDNCHFENDNGAVKLTIGAHFGNFGNTIKNSQFDTSTGIDGGNGFILSTDANSQIAFDDNAVANTPDTFFAGTSTKFVSWKGTMNLSSGAPYTSPNSSVRNIVGYDPDSPSLKHKRVSTGAIGGGTRANVAVTWATQFADANYSVVCSVIDSTTATTVAGLVLERENIVQTAAGTAVTVFNPTGGNVTGVVVCTAFHD